MAVNILNMFGLIRKNYRNNIQNYEICVNKNYRTNQKMNSGKEFVCNTFGADGSSLQRLFKFVQGDESLAGWMCNLMLTTLVAPSTG